MQKSIEQRQAEFKVLIGKLGEMNKIYHQKKYWIDKYETIRAEWLVELEVLKTEADNHNRLSLKKYLGLSFLIKNANINHNRNVKDNNRLVDKIVNLAEVCYIMFDDLLKDSKDDKWLLCPELNDFNESGRIIVEPGLIKPINKN